MKIDFEYRDWDEIFYALAFKREHSAAVKDDAEWIAHLENIMEKIMLEAAKEGVTI